MPFRWQAISLTGRALPAPSQLVSQQLQARGTVWSVQWLLQPRLLHIRAANVQLYNTSLTTNELQALYIEGIGGAPLVLQNLVGWWPLNGDIKDYGGNGFNGYANAMTFSTQWYSSYVPP